MCTWRFRKRYALCTRLSSAFIAATIVGLILILTMLKGRGKRYTAPHADWQMNDEFAAETRKTEETEVANEGREKEGTVELAEQQPATGGEDTMLTRQQRSEVQPLLQHGAWIQGTLPLGCADIACTGARNISWHAGRGEASNTRYSMYPLSKGFTAVEKDRTMFQVPDAHLAESRSPNWHFLPPGSGLKGQRPSEVVRSWGRRGDYHIVTDFTDEDEPGAFEHDCAVLMKSSTSCLYTQRYGAFITLPLPSMQAPIPIEVRTDQASRTVLAFFAGSTGTNQEVRQQVVALDNGKDMRMCDTLKTGNNGCKYHYQTELARCRYGIVPPGAGAHSYRLMEVMAAGAVPVIIGDLIAPFSAMLRWDKLSIHVAVDRVASVPALLRKIPTSEWEAKQRNVVTAFEAFFSSEQKIVDTAFSVIQHDMTWCSQ